MPAPLAYIEPKGRFRGNVPLSLAVKVGQLIFVSGVPGYDADGKLAVGDFRAQMTQSMDNIGAILRDAGSGWDRVVRMKVFLTRPADFEDMNRIYAGFFPSGKYPARTTLYVPALPKPDFLLEIECEAVA